MNRPAVDDQAIVQTTVACDRSANLHATGRLPQSPIYHAGAVVRAANGATAGKIAHTGDRATIADDKAVSVTAWSDGHGSVITPPRVWPCYQHTVVIAAVTVNPYDTGSAGNHTTITDDQGVAGAGKADINPDFPDSLHKSMVVTYNKAA